jgi:hypothetical protein
MRPNAPPARNAFDTGTAARPGARSFHALRMDHRSAARPCGLLRYCEVFGARRLVRSLLIHSAAQSGRHNDRL